jgi:hypothetical protein
METNTEQKYDLAIEVDGKEFGLRTTFNPDAGTPQGDIDIFDKETGEYLDEMCGVSLPDESDEDSGDLKRIKEYIHENLIF